MKQQKVLYEDVVGGGSPVRQNSGSKKQPSYPDENPKTSEKSSGQSSKKAGKDEQSQSSLGSRAEKLAEDPFLKESEIREGDTKEKEEKAEEEESKNSKGPKEEMDILVSRSNKTLFHAKTMFPFDLFPDTVSIDGNKVDIIQGNFFYTDYVRSVLLKEIMDVRVESTLFFGRLIIDYGPHPLKISTVTVEKLKKDDAMRAKEIIEGVLVLYRSENINTTELKPEDTIEGIKEIGQIEEMQ